MPTSESICKVGYKKMAVKKYDCIIELSASRMQREVWCGIRLNIAPRIQENLRLFHILSVLVNEGIIGCNECNPNCFF